MIPFRLTMAIIAILQFAVASLFVAAMAWPSLAGAHEWYDTDCCDTRDCRPISGTNADGTRWSELREVEAGYEWTSSQTGRVYVFPHSSPKVRPSRNGEYHGCEIVVGEGPANGASIGMCIYIPLFF
jgi:hypothetical protein